MLPAYLLHTLLSFMTWCLLLWYPDQCVEREGDREIDFNKPSL